MPPTSPCPSEEEILTFVCGSAPRPPGFEEHLYECERCRILAGEAARLPDQTADERPSVTTLKTGAVLAGRYEIRRFVARGGMGEVYEVRDNLLSSTLALKTLAPTVLDDGRAVARLKEEVLLARRVSHPNVCRILEFGVHELALPGSLPLRLPFLTMELLAGETLGQRLRRAGAMSPDAALPLLCQMAAGLQAIHGANIVHRDFKSDNVFLVPSEGTSERAVVMDMGLARPLEVRQRSLTAGLIVGTVDYMAPEQVEGGPPSAAFDVYAFGVVMYEMLTGQRPFAGTSDLGTAVKKLSTRAPAPSMLAPVSRAWDQLVARCLVRDAGKRIAGMDLVERELASLAAHPGGSRRMSGRSWRLSLSFGALVVLAGFAGTAVWSMNPARGNGGQTRQSPPPVAVTAPPDPPRTVARIAQVESPPPAPAPPPRRKMPARTRPAAPTRSVLMERAERLLVDGDVASACQTASQAAALAPQDPGVHLFLGRCFMRLLNPARARDHYRRYLELAPDATDAFFVRAILDKGR
jgi:serine/threonine protein kinase